MTWSQRPGHLAIAGLLCTSAHHGPMRMCRVGRRLRAGLDFLSLKCHSRQIRLTHAQFGGPSWSQKIDGLTEGVTSTKNLSLEFWSLWCVGGVLLFLGLNGVHSHPQTYSWSSLSSLCHPSPAWVPSVFLVFCPLSGRTWSKDISYLGCDELACSL